jgi:hypothetical protein
MFRSESSNPVALEFVAVFSIVDFSDRTYYSAVDLERNVEKNPCNQSLASGVVKKV